MPPAPCLAHLPPPLPPVSPTWESPGPAGRPHTAPPGGSASGPAAQRSRVRRARNTAPVPRAPRPPGPAPALTAARCAYVDGGLGYVGVPPKASPPPPTGAPLPDVPVNVHSVHAQGSGNGARVLPASSPKASQHVGRGVVASCLGSQRGSVARPALSGPPPLTPMGLPEREVRGWGAGQAKARAKVGIPA